MLEMEKAWHKGISPYQFRKSRMDDLDFIFDMRKAKQKIKEENARQMRAENLKNQLARGIRNG